MGKSSKRSNTEERGGYERNNKKSKRGNSNKKWHSDRTLGTPSSLSSVSSTSSTSEAASIVSSDDSNESDEVANRRRQRRRLKEYMSNSAKEYDNESYPYKTLCIHPIDRTLSDDFIISTVDAAFADHSYEYTSRVYDIQARNMKLIYLYFKSHVQARNARTAHMTVTIGKKKLRVCCIRENKLRVSELHEAPPSEDSDDSDEDGHRRRQHSRAERLARQHRVAPVRYRSRSPPPPSSSSPSRGDHPPPTTSMTERQQCHLAMDMGGSGSRMPLMVDDYYPRQSADVYARDSTSMYYDSQRYGLLCPPSQAAQPPQLPTPPLPPQPVPSSMPPIPIFREYAAHMVHQQRAVIANYPFYHPNPAAVAYEQQQQYNMMYQFLGKAPPSQPTSFVPYGGGGGGRPNVATNMFYPRPPVNLPPEYDPQATRTLFVGNLSLNVTEDDLRQIFAQFGYIEDVDIKRQTKATVTTYAFVKFRNMDMAYAAKVRMEDCRIGDYQCKVGYGKQIPSPIIWVGGLGKWMSAARLSREFMRFGRIMNMEYLVDECCAYILYETVESATCAVKLTHRCLIDPEHILKADYADPGVLVSVAPSSPPQGAPTEERRQVPSPPPTPPPAPYISGGHHRREDSLERERRRSSRRDSSGSDSGGKNSRYECHRRRHRRRSSSSCSGDTRSGDTRRTRNDDKSLVDRVCQYTVKKAVAAAAAAAAAAATTSSCSDDMEKHRHGHNGRKHKHGKHDRVDTDSNDVNRNGDFNENCNSIDGPCRRCHKKNKKKKKKEKRKEKEKKDREKEEGHVGNRSSERTEEHKEQCEGVGVAVAIAIEVDSISSDSGERTEEHEEQCEGIGVPVAVEVDSISSDRGERMGEHEVQCEGVAVAVPVPAVAVEVDSISSNSGERMGELEEQCERVVVAVPVAVEVDSISSHSGERMGEHEEQCEGVAVAVTVAVEVDSINSDSGNVENISHDDRNNNGDRDSDVEIISVEEAPANSGVDADAVHQGAVVQAVPVPQNGGESAVDGDKHPLEACHEMLREEIQDAEGDSVILRLVKKAQRRAVRRARGEKVKEDTIIDGVDVSLLPVILDEDDGYVSPFSQIARNGKNLSKLATLKRLRWVGLIDTGDSITAGRFYIVAGTSSVIDVIQAPSNDRDTFPIRIFYTMKGAEFLLRTLYREVQQCRNRYGIFLVTEVPIIREQSEAIRMRDFIKLLDKSRDIACSVLIKYSEGTPFGYVLLFTPKRFRQLLSIQNDLSIDVKYLNSRHMLAIAVDSNKIMV